MKHLILAGLVSLVILSGFALAHQSEDEKKGSSMKDMRQEMMKGKEPGEGGMHGMGDMGGMMGMMKMMEQCSDMMKAAHHHHDEKAKESQKK
jgi:hypothetical protein